MLDFLFSPEGRVSRGAYLISVPLLVMFLFLIGSTARFGAELLPVSPSLKEEILSTVLFAVILVLGWDLFALSVKRRHDTGSSGFWMLLGPLDLIFIAWIRGNRGANKYGDDPLADRGREKRRRAAAKKAPQPVKIGSVAKRPSPASPAKSHFPKARSWPFKD